MSLAKAPQSFGVITVPGDRRDEDIEAFGALAARTFDRIVIREDAHLRGRARGEVAGILRWAVTGAGLPGDRITVVLDEVEAVHRAIDLADPGALVVAMVDRVSLVWESLQARAGHQPSPGSEGDHQPVASAYQSQVTLSSAASP